MSSQNKLLQCWRATCLILISGTLMQQTSAYKDDSVGSNQNHHTEHNHPKYNIYNQSNASSALRSTHHNWMRTEQMDSNGQFWLDWHLLGRTIYFRITANTQGFVGLGFSLKHNRMADADLVVAWVDDRTGKTHVLVR